MPSRDLLRFVSPLHRHAPAALAALLFTAVLVASDSTPGRSAQAPAELISVTDPAVDNNNASISDDGAFVAYDADGPSATPTASRVRNRAAGTTADVSDPAEPFEGDLSRIRISGDGCHVVRLSEAIAVTDVCAGGPARLIYTPDCGCDLINPRISTHGRYVTVVRAYEDEVLWFDRDLDENGVLDDTEVEMRAITATDNNPGAALGDETLTQLVAVVLPDTDPDAPVGSFQVYLWDPMIDIGDPEGLTLVSAQNGSITAPLPRATATFPSMTPDGRFVAFVSSTDSSNGDLFSSGQIMVRDTLTSETVLVSRSSAGATSNGDSSMPSISADGTQVVFGTTSDNLLAPNPGGVAHFCAGEIPVCFGPSFDLLVATSTSGFYETLELDRVSLDRNGAALQSRNPLRTMLLPDISASGRWVAFQSSFRQEIENGTPTPPVEASAVYVIERPATAVITPLDFGTVTVGTTSAPSTATVTNTGSSSIMPATITATGGYTVVPGGTCASQTWLSPRRSCTVNVTFTPAAAGPATGQLRIDETGYAAYSATGTLTGTGFVVPPSTTTTSTTSTTSTTTIPAEATTTVASTTTVENDPAVPVDITTTTTTTTPAPTTPTTGPRPVATPTTAPATTAARAPKLIITPSPGSFGTALVGTATPPLTFAVTSTGTGSAAVGNVTASGPDASSFTIIDTTCAGVSLRPGTSCSVTVVFTPARAGVHTATLTDGSSSVTAASALDGTGTIAPTIRLLPNVVGLGEVTVAIGAGFVPDSSVRLHWVDGATYDARADSAGNITVQVPIRPDELVGPRTFGAVDQPGLFLDVTTPALIVDPTAQPPTGRNPAIPGLGTLVTRG